MARPPPFPRSGEDSWTYATRRCGFETERMAKHPTTDYSKYSPSMLAAFETKGRYMMQLPHIQHAVECAEPHGEWIRVWFCDDPVRSCYRAGCDVRVASIIFFGEAFPE